MNIKEVNGKNITLEAENSWDALKLGKLCAVVNPTNINYNPADNKIAATFYLTALIDEIIK